MVDVISIQQVHWDDADMRGTYAAGKHNFLCGKL